MNQTRFSFLTRSYDRFISNYADLIKELQANGIIVEVVAPERTKQDKQILSTIEFKTIPSANHWSPLRDLLVEPILVAHYNENPPSLIHVTDLSLLPSALLAAKTLRIQQVVLSISEQMLSVKTIIEKIRLQTGFATIIEKSIQQIVRQITPHLALIIVHGRARHQKLLHILPNKNTSLTLPLDCGMGINIEQFLQKISRKKAKKNTRTLIIPVFSATIFTIFATIKFINSALPLNYQIILIGTDQLSPYAKVLLKRKLSSSSKITFAKSTPFARKNAYNKSDLMVVFGPRQTLYLMEAAACRVPALVSDLPLYRAIVRHELSGWIVSEQNTFLSHCKQLFADPTKLRNAGKQAQMRAARLFDRKLTVKRINRAYKQIFSPPKNAFLTKDGQIASQQSSKRELIHPVPF